MSERRLHTWQVEGVAVGTKYGREQNHNYSYQVVAETMEQAMAGVREKHPDFKVVKVIKDRWIDDVIVAHVDGMRADGRGVV